MKGIETRLGADGIQRYRGTAYVNRTKHRGPWTEDLEQAAEDRARMLAGKIPPPRRSPGGLIYFIQPAGGGAVKIGHTQGPIGRRLTGLQTGHPQKLVIIGVRPGAREDEQALHARLARYRIQGEWFLPAPAVLVAAAGDGGEFTEAERELASIDYDKVQARLRYLRHPHRYPNPDEEP